MSHILSSISVEKNFLFASVVVLTLIGLSFPGKAQSSIEGTAHFVIAPSLPLEHEPVKISLEGQPENSFKGTVYVKDPQGETVLQKQIDAENGHVVTWTPEQTGYHELSFIGPKGSKIIDKKIAVVWSRLYFPFWPPLKIEHADDFPLLSSTVLVKNTKEIKSWQKRGATVLGVCYYRKKYHLDMDLTEQKAVDKLVNRWKKPLDAGADGIWIDEFTAYPDAEGLAAVAVEMKALRKLRELYPNKIISSAVGGAIIREYAIGHKNADALVTSETYGEFHNMVHGTHSVKKRIDRRIETMRNTDLVFERGYSRRETPPGEWNRHGGIILLSTNHAGGGIWEYPAVERLEYYVRYIKQTAPEMPGIGFWSPGKSDSYMRSVGFYKAAEKMAEKYYVNPVIAVRDIFFSSYEPRVGNAMEIYVSVHNIGGMQAENFTLALHAVSGSKKIEIGERKINRIGKGFKVIENKTDKVESVEKYGNTYMLAPEGKYVADVSRQTHSFEWMPAEPGTYKIVATLKKDTKKNITFLKDSCETSVRVFDLNP